jgi:hypothetical protein
MKYVIFHIPATDQQMPVIFPTMLVHADVGKMLAKAFPFPVVPVSAGEVHFESAGAVCSGASETLQLSSREQDASIIDTLDYRHGLMYDFASIPYDQRKRK